MGQRRLRKLGNAGVVPLLLLFLVLRDNVGQVYIARVGLLAGICQGMHLINLALELEAFRI